MKKFERVGLFLLTGGISELVLRPLEAVEKSKKNRAEMYTHVTTRIFSSINLKKFIEANSEKEIYDMYIQALTAAQSSYQEGDIYSAENYISTCERISEAIVRTVKD